MFRHNTESTNQHVSLPTATATDQIQSTALFHLLDQYQMNDTTSSQTNRTAALNGITTLIYRWAQQQLKIDATNVANFVRLDPFGSIALGLSTPTADLDLLCTTTNHSKVSIGQFFATFVTILQNSVHVTSLTAAEQAYVPSIKFNYDGINVDMVFCQFSFDQFPAVVDFTLDKYISEVNPAHCKALNGVRNAKGLLKAIHVANPTNGYALFTTMMFTTMMKLIKLWAKRRGIYSNAQGYLGGISYAILSAYIIQRFPNATLQHLPLLLQNFFTTFAAWKSTPVLLGQIEEGMHLRRSNRGLDAPWSLFSCKFTPKFPIITPTFPAINSSYNVQKATYPILKAELDRAALIFQVINQTTLPTTSPDSVAAEKGNPIDDNNTATSTTTTANSININHDLAVAHYRKLYKEELLCPFNFISSSQQCLDVIVTTRTSQEMSDWHGFVESKLRLLCDDGSSSTYILRPFPQRFVDPKNSCLVHFYISVMQSSNPCKSPPTLASCNTFAYEIQQFRRLCNDPKFTARTSGMKVNAELISTNSIPMWVKRQVE